MPKTDGIALPSFPPSAQRVAPERAMPSEREPLLSRNLSHASNLAREVRSAAREMRSAASSIGHAMGRALSSLENTMGRRFGDARASVAPMPSASAASAASAAPASATSSFVSVGNARESDTRFAGYPIAFICDSSSLGSNAFEEVARYDWQGLRGWEQTQFHAWEEAGAPTQARGPSEQRLEASSRIQAFQADFHRSEGTRTLDLRGLGLTSCPPLPDGVEHLDLTGNPLRRLPTEWPGKMTSLSLSSKAVTDGHARRQIDGFVQRGVTVSISFE